MPVRKTRRATVNYMNALASGSSINQYGEGCIAKILIKHLLDTKPHTEILNKFLNNALRRSLRSIPHVIYTQGISYLVIILIK